MCSSTSGKKVRLPTDPLTVIVLAFNSSFPLQCHLELSLPSSLYGFNVFIKELSLSGSQVSGCFEDFVQFGRDILFVTTHLSEKYCGDIKVPVSKVQKTLRKLNFGDISAERRFYIEENDREMDIWVKIGSETSRNKIVNLVVSPFLKLCGKNDDGWKKCIDRRNCIRKDLFCDGQVNCQGDETDCKVDTKIKKNSSDLCRDKIISLSVIFGVIIVSIMTTVIICQKRKKKTIFQNCDQNSSEVFPSYPPPQLPPPYSIADAEVSYYNQ